jgi:hypothetical protein
MPDALFLGPSCHAPSNSVRFAARFMMSGRTKKELRSFAAGIVTLERRLACDHARRFMAMSSDAAAVM